MERLYGTRREKWNVHRALRSSSTCLCIFVFRVMFASITICLVLQIRQIRQYFDSTNTTAICVYLLNDHTLCVIMFVYFTEINKFSWKIELQKKFTDRMNSFGTPPTNDSSLFLPHTHTLLIDDLCLINEHYFNKTRYGNCIFAWFDLGNKEKYRKFQELSMDFSVLARK